MFSDNFTLKVVIMVLLALLKLAAGLGPMVFSPTLRDLGHHRMRVYASLSLCVGGGVLLASCMLHMIPEVREHVLSVLPNTTFPLAELLVCCGFFLVYVIEETVNVFAQPQGPRTAEAELRLHGKVAPITDSIKSFENPNIPSNGISFGRDALVLTAMILHSALEGFALGLQTAPQSIWLLFTAILIHSAVVHFSFGLKLLVENKPDVQIVIFMCSLALSTPLGGAFGMMAVFNDHSPSWWVVVGLKGLAAGSLLYVTFFEVLITEKNKKGFVRLLCVLFGFSLTVVFQIFAGHCPSCANGFFKTNST